MYIACKSIESDQENNVKVTKIKAEKVIKNWWKFNLCCKSLTKKAPTIIPNALVKNRKENYVYETFWLNAKNGIKGPSPTNKAP